MVVHPIIEILVVGIKISIWIYMGYNPSIDFGTFMQFIHYLYVLILVSNVQNEMNRDIT